MEILNKKQLQQIAFNHSLDIDFREFSKSLQKRYCRVIFFPSH